MDTKTEANSFDDFIGRFDSLAKEAKGFGIESMVILIGEDPLSDTERTNYIRNTGPTKALGMLEYCRYKVIQRAEGGQ